MSKVMHHKKAGYQKKIKRGERNAIFIFLNSKQYDREYLKELGLVSI